MCVYVNEERNFKEYINCCVACVRVHAFVFHVRCINVYLACKDFCGSIQHKIMIETIVLHDA